MVLIATLIYNTSSFPFFFFNLFFLFSRSITHIYKKSSNVFPNYILFTMNINKTCVLLEFNRLHPLKKIRCQPIHTKNKWKENNEDTCLNKNNQHHLSKTLGHKINELLEDLGLFKTIITCQDKINNTLIYDLSFGFYNFKPKKNNLLY